MKKNVDYTLYVCTDRGLMSSPTVEESVEQAIQGGCTVVQLREKSCSSREFYEMACKVKEVTDRYGIPLIINDRVDIALAVDAAGVHVGQSDLPATVVRKILGDQKILGVSAATVEEAVRAQQEGADYLGVGAMYTTGTKKDTRNVTRAGLTEICKEIEIPVVAIGGINKENARELRGTGISGLAVVSAVVAQKNVAAAARELREIFLS
ncbi:MAG: thiamine phosphate synthase [Blautia sp.]